MGTKKSSKLLQFEYFIDYDKARIDNQVKLEYFYVKKGNISISCG
jgi:hypothetical protein